MQFVGMGVLPEHKSAKVKQIKNPPGWFQLMVGSTGASLILYILCIFQQIINVNMCTCLFICTYSADAFILRDLEGKNVRNFS